MNTIVICNSMIFEVDKGPNMNGWQAGCGPWAAVENPCSIVHCTCGLCLFNLANLELCKLRCQLKDVNETCF